MAEEPDYTFAANGEGQGYENFSGDAEAAEPMDDTEKAAGDAGEENCNDDEDDRKLFVGNLSWETGQKDLRDYFSKFGEVTNCTLKTDLETRRSRGFGFVVFKDAAAVDKVLEESEHKLQGRAIDPKKANPRQEKEINRKIFVGKLDPNIPEADVRTYFGTFGKIEKLDLPYDKLKEQRRSFCFIEFEKEESAKKVTDQTDPHKINDVEIDVKKATPNNQNKRGRGGFGGWGGSWGGGRGGRGGRGGGWGNQGYNQGYYNQGYDGYGGYGGYAGYGGYGGYGGYNNQGYGSGGWGYDQSYYQGYGDYNNGGWGYDQGNQQQSTYGKQKGGRGGGGYHPYNR